METGTGFIQKILRVFQLAKVFPIKVLIIHTFVLRIIKLTRERRESASKCKDQTLAILKQGMFDKSFITFYFSCTGNDLHL